MWGPREGAEAAKGLPGGPLPPGEADGEGSADCIRARPDLTHFCGCCHQPLASVAGIPKEAANPPLPALPAVASAATSKMDKSSAMVSDASSDLSPKCPAKASGGGDAATAAGGADIGTCSGAGDEQEAAPAPPAAEDSGAAQPAGGVANSVADASTSAAAAGAVTEATAGADEEDDDDEAAAAAAPGGGAGDAAEGSCSAGATPGTSGRICRNGRNGVRNGVSAGVGLCCPLQPPAAAGAAAAAVAEAPAEGTSCSAPPGAAAAVAATASTSSMRLSTLLFLSFLDFFAAAAAGETGVEGPPSGELRGRGSLSTEDMLCSSMTMFMKLGRLHASLWMQLNAKSVIEAAVGNGHCVRESSILRTRSAASPESGLMSSSRKIHSSLDSATCCAGKRPVNNSSNTMPAE
mmetsp:Transcript_173925/g.557481  ORF Transcript_173925/g.557481 Transcript_173925/m.557481 type:complete len:407 (-) Transcript_173925:1050-2270(-)